MTALLPLLLGLTPTAFAQDDDVVVHGERDPADPKTAGASVTVISIDERLAESDDLSHAVQRAPGSTVRRLGGLGGFSSVSLRGAASRQVQVFIDGIPLNPDGSAAINLAELPMRAFERVEVWRGAGPASLAASPLGGVISLRTRREAQTPLSMTAGTGSWGSWTGSVSGAEGRGPVQVVGAVSGLSSQADFPAYYNRGTTSDLSDDSRDRRQGNDRHQLSGLIRLRGSAGRDWSALGVLTRREEGVAGPVGSAPDGRLNTTWAMAAARLALSDTANVRTWLQVRDERRNVPFVVAGVGPTPSLDTLIYNRFYQAGVHGHGRVITGETLSFGGTAQLRADVYQSLPVPSTVVPPAPSRRGSATAAFDAHWTPSDRFAVDPVLNVQGWLEQLVGSATTRLAVNPRISARFTASDHWVLHAAGGRAVRPPDFTELFGNRGNVQGRTNLKPEKGWWADAGIRWLPGPVRAEANVFLHDAVDRIVFTQNGQTTVIPVNIGRSRSGGLELAADGQIGEFADVAVSGTWTEAWNLDGAGTRLPRIPALSGNLNLGLRLKDRVRLSYNLDATGPTAWDSANITIGPRRALHAVALKVRPSPAWPAITGEVRNLANTIVQVAPVPQTGPDGPRVLNPIGDFAGYPLPGRTFMLTLRWTPGDAD